jgi:hypothetical protein
MKIVELTERLRQADLLNQQNMKAIADFKGQKPSPVKKVSVTKFDPPE